jgi:CheY-like chemotaxis protein
LFTGTTPAPRTDRVTLRLSGTVLVAEDNPVNQRVALSLLEKLGLTVDLASDGNEAIAACSRRSYDLVLMDCRMPDKDGMEATTAIRRKESAAPGSRHLPIIALTAGVTAEERNACLAVGMDAVLHKPIRRENLVAILQRWLPSRPATPATDIRMAALESASTGDPPLLDLDVFRRLRDETDDIDALFQLFVDERTVQIPALCTAVKDAPFDEVFTMAHRLKGAALTLGVRRFIARLLSIEQAATARNRIACIDACADLPILADSSIAAIARQL